MVQQVIAGSNLGDYELIKSLGHGGMAEVFLAKQSGISGFQRLVALKVIHPTHSEDPSFIEALVQEAKVAVQLSHPNIGQVHDLGKVENIYFIVMDFIDGKDLYRLLFESSQQNRPIPVDIALFVAEQIAGGLGYCHERLDHYGRAMNLVHRDVSPQNIFLSWQGDVKILDFGIAKVSHRLRHTEAGVIKGKLQYMSPEQISGAPLDHRSDLFSCGICLFEMLAGEMARGEADPLDLLDKIRRAEFKSLRVIRPDLDLRIVQLVERLLSVDPEDRYESGEALSRALLRLRLELFPDFRPARLGDFLLSVFNGSPFYLEDSQITPPTVIDDELDQSVSLSSSILFGDEKPELVPGTDETSIIEDDTLNLPSNEVLSQDGDTLDGGDSHQGQSGSQSGLHGSSMEATNLFEAPRLDRAHPYVDPSTNSGFAKLAPGDRADPKGRLTPYETSAEAPGSIDKLHGQPASMIAGRSQGGDPSRQSLGLLEHGEGVRSANPFDASVETRSQPIVRNKGAMGAMPKLFRSKHTHSNRTLSRRFTLWVLGALVAYFSFFVLPSLVGTEKASVVALHLMTEPKGARIYLDGQDSQRTTNVTVSVPTDRDTAILLTLDGYRPSAIEIDVATKQKVEPNDRIERLIMLIPQ